MMPIQSTNAVKLLAAGVFALTVALAPAVGLGFGFGPAVAHAEGEGGVPAPEPVPVPEPQAGQSGDSAGCQAGESLNPQNGNCEPTMSAIPAGAGDAPIEQAPPPNTGDTTSTYTTGIGADLVPNINGDSCTGYWESTVCYAEQGQAAVQPKSTISSSP